MKVLGIDSSTQSVKVEVRDADSGALLERSTARHPSTTPPVSEQDPEAWWSALQQALGQVNLDGVGAAAVGGQQHGLVLLDETGAPLRPAKLWNDTESADEAAAMVAELGADGWARACGSVPGAAFTVTKLAWVAAHEPELLERVAKVMLPHDYLTWRLTGAHVTDRGDASGTGWWSPQTGSYLTEMQGQLSADRFPKVLGPTEAAGEWNGIVIGPGSGDNMAAALGLGLRPGDLAVSLGTSGTAYAVSETPTMDASGAVAGFADATGAYLPLVCTLNATKVTDTIARLMGVGYAELDSLASDGRSNGVTLVPYFDGERTPNLPNSTGWITGLRSDATREQLARAAFEGVACGLLDGVDALADAGVKATGRFFLIGGGSRAASFRDAFAGLSGRDLIVPDADETVATGACVQAAVVAGLGTFAEVADRWGLGAGERIEREPMAEAGAIREAYRVASGLQAG